MYVNCGYLNHLLRDEFEQSTYSSRPNPMIVGSCGEYRLISYPRYGTKRPKGRKDYQLLYIAAGQGHFVINGVDRVLSAGHLVLYHPDQPQDYYYLLQDQPSVFWIHFTGTEVPELLRHLGLTPDKPILSTGVIPEYKRLFRQIIQELQLAKPMYEDVLVAQTRQLLALAARNLNRDGHVSGAMQQEMDDAIQYFNKHFAQSISVEEYAKNLHISTAWFIHSFKEHTGMTPMQYILSLRVSNAQTLLETTNYTITEIAAIVGYDNPLYFSRIFKKQLGVSPQQYRSQREKQQDLS